VESQRNLRYASTDVWAPEQVVQCVPKHPGDRKGVVIISEGLALQHKYLWQLSATDQVFLQSRRSRGFSQITTIIDAS